MRQRCSGSEPFTVLRHRVRARQTAYWAGLLDGAQEQIEAEDRAYWDDDYFPPKPVTASSRHVKAMTTEIDIDF